MNKDNTTYSIIELIFLISLTSLFLQGCSIDTSNDDVIGKLKATDCLPEQRNVNACIEIYQPVCGQIQIQCITTPCDPVKETFENSCKACANPRVISYTQGECSSNSEVKK